MSSDAPGPRLPAGACDSHMHVFGPPDRFPGAPDRTYDPRERSLAEYEAVARRLGLERVVFVQPSAYGTDNSCLLDALRQRPDTARAVAVVDPACDRATLEEMHRLGVRGLRLNLMTPRITSASAARRRLEQAARMVEGLGWHVQIYADLDIVETSAPAVRELAVPVVFDHMGGAQEETGPFATGFRTLLSLVADGAAWVKLSGADIVTWQNSDFSGATAFARDLIDASPDRLVWGTDWPHLVHQSSGSGDDAPPAAFRAVDEASQLRFLTEWAGDDDTLRRILVTNPASLYQF